MQGYLVVVEGDYFGAASEYDRKREKYPYRITVKVPKPEGALSLIKNKLLDKVLRRNYDNYHAWRTHQLVSITNLDGSKVYGLTDPRLMDFNDLADYVKRHKLPLKLELYTDLGFFRTMVYLAETNQHEFKIKQENLARECAEDKKLAELNPELYGSQGSQGLHRMTAKDINTTIPQREVTKKALIRDRTSVVEGKIPEPKIEKEKGWDGYKTVESPASTMVTEDKAPKQKKEKVYVKGEGFVNADDFKEDFDRPEEKEYEVYDPTKIMGTEDELIQDEELSVEDL